MINVDKYKTREFSEDDTVWLMAYGGPNSKQTQIKIDEEALHDEEFRENTTEVVAEMIEKVLKNDKQH